MQAHTSAIVDPAAFTAYLNPGENVPFAVVTMGDVRFYAETAAGCDAVIRIWTLAKTLLASQPVKAG